MSRKADVEYLECRCEFQEQLLKSRSTWQIWQRTGLFMNVLTTIDLFLGFALIFKCASGMIVKFFGENECSKTHPF